MGDAEVLFVRGSVTSTDGTPLPEAVIDIWQTGPSGGYDTLGRAPAGVQLPRALAGGGRGRRATSSRRCCPSPTRCRPRGRSAATWRRWASTRGGPRTSTSRSRRPATSRSTTQVFFPDDPYLEDDTIGAVKAALVRPVEPEDDHLVCPFDIVLRPVLEPVRELLPGRAPVRGARRGRHPAPALGRGRARPRDAGRGARRPAAERRAGGARRRDAAARRPPPGQGHLRRAQLQGARRGGRLRGARLPGAVLQVRRDAGRGRRAGAAAAGVRGRRLRGRAGVRGRPRGAPRERGRGARGGRRLHARQRRQHARLPVQDAPVAAGQELGGLDPARPVSW